MVIREIIFRGKKFKVDNRGIVYNADNKIAKQQINSSGYKCITSDKCYLIHRVIATAFIPNPENKGFVNHKNGNKLDNSVENLEWMTKSENEIHSVRILGNKRNVEGLRANWENPIHRKKVDLYSMGMTFIKTFDSCTDTAKYLKCTGSAVNSCLKKRNKSVRRYIVKYHLI